MKKYLSFVLVLGGVLLLSACSYNNQSYPSPAAVVPAPDQNAAAVNNAPNVSTPTPAKKNDAALISVKDFSFTPATMTVPKGTTITWINNDSAPHQISAAGFSSERLATGQSFSFTFNTVGTFDYICSIHPSMRGTIIVQ
jgi:plastocyanin